MGSFKDFDKKAPAPGTQLSGDDQNLGGNRKNEEEIGEPVQLPDDRSSQQPSRGDKKQRGAKRSGGEEHASNR